MALFNRAVRPGRNKDGTYDLTDAEQAQPTRKRPSYSDAISMQASRERLASTRTRHSQAVRQGSDQSSGDTGPLAAQASAERPRTGASERPSVASRRKATASRGNAALQADAEASGKQLAVRRKSELARYSRETAQGRYKARKGGLGKRNILIAAVCVLVIALGVGGFAFASWYGNIAGNLAGDPERNTAMAEATGTEPYYVLLLGGDSRVDKKEDNRTDSMMVARIDEQNKSVSLISVPRDLRVDIPGHEGYHKINSVIELGGFDAVVAKVNAILDIQINYYAFIYFDGFEQLVDKLDGVKVDVPEGTYYHGVWVPAGKNVQITGEEALVLARCRHGYPPDEGAYAMGDYQRTLNQRNLIKAIAKKILKQDVTAMPALIEGLSECVETNMDIGKIIETAQNLKGMDVGELNAAQMPIGGVDVGGEWFAVMYQDVFEVMAANFRSGRDLMDGLAGFDTSCNDNDCTWYYEDGSPYSHTSYLDLYGNFTEPRDDDGSE